MDKAGGAEKLRILVIPAAVLALIGGAWLGGETFLAGKVRTALGQSPDLAVETVAPLRDPTRFGLALENIGFNDGKGQATVIERAGRHALRVKDADAPTRTGFAGLDYWPADPAWRVTGRFVPHPAGRTLDVASVINTIEPMPNPGAIEFERGGHHYRLEALDEGDGGLSLIFADRTNGHGSYGAGRFLDADMPGADGRVVLDFNRSYNPPCAFTAYATCPLPPPENRLDLAVTAGEKIYAHSVH